ncbi:MAG: glutamyl-tRNA reductase [Vicinamibacterales bacterium]
MNLLLMGVTHRTAPVELRERLDFASRDVGAAVEALGARPGVMESVVLSTCNRSEVYVAAPHVERAREELLAFLAEYHHVPRAAFVPHLFERQDAEAVHHLFRVASGLDSLVVGEPQILGQVKDAFSTAAERRSAGPFLNRLFHASFAVGKRVRSETAVGEGAVSVSFAAVQLARKIFGRLNERRVLVIGAGEMGKLTTQHLRAQGVGEIVITSRTLAHAEALAGAVHGTAVAWSEMMTALAPADIVITATGSQQPILSRAHVESVMGRGRRDPLFIIDIAIPRDVDPAAAEMEQVFLYNVDDLQAVVQENLSRRTKEIQQAEAIVAEDVARFMSWYRSRGAIPTVVALRQRFDAIRRAELQRLDGKLAGLPPEARARMDEVTRLIMEKLLLEPTEQLKALPDEETQAAYTEAVNRLFGLRPEEQVTRTE